MAHDPVLVENTKAWFAKADVDIRDILEAILSRLPSEVRRV